MPLLKINEVLDLFFFDLNDLIFLQNLVTDYSFSNVLIINIPKLTLTKCYFIYFLFLFYIFIINRKISEISAIDNLQIIYR